jgi:class 3 adenylate cyclase
VSGGGSSANDRANDRAIELLAELGADRDELERALAEDRLRSLALQLLVAPASRMTFAEATTAAGVDPEVARRLWRAWGLPPVEHDDRRFGAEDLPVFQFAALMEATVGREVAFHTSRVMGTSLSRIAEAEISMVRSVIEAPLVASGADLASVIGTYRELIATLLPMSFATIEVLHRHAMVESARRQDAMKVAPSTVNRTQTLVGFADLTGSTTFAVDRTLEELDAMLAAFEERAADVIADGGALLVKRIGDAVMFTAPSAAVGASVALDLVERFDDELVPPLRVGLAHGSVVALRGDYYGLPVNLAARLLGVAEPSSVLASESVAAALGDQAYRCAPVGEVVLAGFPHAMTAVRVTR